MGDFRGGGGGRGDVFVYFVGELDLKDMKFVLLTSMNILAWQENLIIGHFWSTVVARSALFTVHGVT